MAPIQIKCRTLSRYAVMLRGEVQFRIQEQESEFGGA
jgi:hypothetical protein